MLWQEAGLRLFCRPRGRASCSALVPRPVLETVHGSGQTRPGPQAPAESFVYAEDVEKQRLCGHASASVTSWEVSWSQPPRSPGCEMEEERCLRLVTGMAPLRMSGEARARPRRCSRFPSGRGRDPFVVPFGPLTASRYLRLPSHAPRAALAHGQFPPGSLGAGDGEEGRRPPRCARHRGDGVQPVRSALAAGLSAQAPQQCTFSHGDPCVRLDTSKALLVATP